MLGHSALSEAPLSALPAASGGTDATALPGAGSLTLTGFAPTVTAVSSVTATPGTGALVIQGYPPTVTVPTSVSVTPGVGSIIITGYAPTVVSGPDVSTFDGHDGSPRKDTSSAGEREREKKNKVALRRAIEQAMAQTLGLPQTDVPVEPVEPVPAKPINRERRQAIAKLLLRSGIDQPEAYSLRKIEKEISAVEKKLQASSARSLQEEEEEDETLFLLLS